MNAALLAALLAASPAAPRRIVTLAPACAEIAGALGLGERLVGVTDFTDWPPNAPKLPKVGSYVSFSVEAIAALEPDLVLATDDGNPEPSLRRLKALGMRVETLHLSGWRAIEEEIERLGAALGRPAEAERAVKEMERTARCVKARLEGVPRPRVLLAYEMAPIVSAGGGTFTDEMLALAGADSATHDVKTAYPRLSAEEVLARAPDVVIVSSMNPSLDVRRWNEWIARWPAIPAVAKGRIHVVDSTNVDRPSQRSALGLLLLAKTIHPSLFANGECAAAP